MEPKHKPQEHWHGSLVMPQAFRPFAHFGTRQAALDRMVLQSARQFHHPTRLQGDLNPGLIQVELDIRRPLTVIDQGFEHQGISGIAAAVVDAGISVVLHRIDEVALARRLKNEGFDGIAYRNAVEDAGSWSLMPLDQGQIRIRARVPIPEIPGQVRELRNSVALPTLEQLVEDHRAELEEILLGVYRHDLAQIRWDRGEENGDLSDWVFETWTPEAYESAKHAIQTVALQPSYPPRLRSGLDWTAGLIALLSPDAPLDTGGLIVEVIEQATAEKQSGPQILLM